jgi:hypothetical protein
MNRMGRFGLALLASASLISCAIGPDSSYVGELSAPGDAQILAAGMAEFVSTQLPAGSSTIALDPTPADQAGNALTPAFAAALRQRGFAIADNRQQPATTAAHHLRYWVTPLDNGDLVRLSIDDRTEASRFFVRNSRGGLQAGGPFMVRQNAEASR